MYFKAPSVDTTKNEMKKKSALKSGVDTSLLHVECSSEDDMVRFEEDGR